MGTGRSDTRIFSRCCGMLWWGGVGVLIQGTHGCTHPQRPGTMAEQQGRQMLELASAGHNCARSGDHLEFCSAVHSSETVSFHRE
jgi:hypothetical protein